jgi:tetratricopeptide (TPR) repeat protein
MDRLALKDLLLPFAIICALLTLISLSANATDATDKQILEFGQKFAQALNDRDQPALTKLIDNKAFGTRVFRDLGMSDYQLEGFLKGFGPATVKIADQMVRLLAKQNGSAKMMGLLARGKERRPFIRIEFEAGGFDYLEFVVSPNANGDYQAVDWYQLTSGQLMSTAVGSAARVLIDPNPNILKSLLGIKSVDKDLVDQVKVIGDLTRLGKHREAIAAIDKLPKEIANSKLFVFRRVQLAGMVNDDALYQKSLATLSELYGDDPTAAALLLDHYIFEKQYGKVIVGITAIQSRFGSDGATQALKSVMYRLNKEIDQSLATAKGAIVLEPDRAASYFVLMDAQLAAAHYDDAVTSMNTLESQFGYSFLPKNVEKLPDMAAFIKSNAYKKWRAKK